MSTNLEMLFNHFLWRRSSLLMQSFISEFVIFDDTQFYFVLLLNSLKSIHKKLYYVIHDAHKKKTLGIISCNLLHRIRKGDFSQSTCSNILLVFSQSRISVFCFLYNLLSPSRDLRNFFFSTRTAQRFTFL